MLKKSTGIDRFQEKYARHIILKELGEEGQRRIVSGRVLIIGAGGLGSPVAMYLAAAGVGTIGIADADKVELSNLQRQIIHTTKDIGRYKVDSAKDRIQAMNEAVKVETHAIYLDSDNITDIVKNYDFVLDCTDNFETKFLINDICVKNKIVFCHAGVTGFEGQLMTVVPGEGPCYRCVFKNPPPEGAVPSCREVGIIVALCGVIGSLQAMEAIKYLAGIGELLTGQLLTYDALTTTFHTVSLPKADKNCKACGDI